MVPMREMEIVGYMKPKHGSFGYCITCSKCATRNDTGEINLTAIYRINIEPYRQTCSTCGAVLVAGADGWCELYDKEDVYAEVK